MYQSKTYAEVTRIRAQLLDLISEVGGSSRRFDHNASVIQDELLMISNNLGRIAGRLAEERSLSLAGTTD
jgi:hypothetical protein